MSRVCLVDLCVPGWPAGVLPLSVPGAGLLPEVVLAGVVSAG
jgi:hypothetical protein